MRNRFINDLTNVAKINTNIALVVGDLGYGVIEEFADLYPDRFFNAGVAEQNMMGLCAGLASEGLHVFAYSIANFPLFRCAEQIRNDVDYHNLPVTIVSVGGGLSYGNLGYSHHAIQDYALIRSFPNMLIASPGDPMEVSSCLDFLIKNPQPSYLRLGKSGEDCIHDAPPKINPGIWLKVKTNKNANKTILTTGAAMSIGMKRLSKNKNKFNLYTMPLWGMKYKNIQSKQIIKHNEINIIEDHLQDGGFGSWMTESLYNDKDLFSRFTFEYLSNDVCGAVGSQEALNKFGGLVP